MLTSISISVSWRLELSSLCIKKENKRRFSKHWLYKQGLLYNTSEFMIFFYRKTFQFQQKFLIKNSSTVSEYWWSGFIWMVQKLELQILHKIVPQAWKYHWKGFIWIVMPKPERFLDFFTAIKCMLPPFKPFYLLYTSTSEIPTLSYIWSLKTLLFWEKPLCIL